jgi:acyl-CoA synthetase (AMP-forming)/AMP-acid ligase II
MAAFKVPAHVVILSEPLPRNAAGKFLKRELRDRVVNGELTSVQR